MLTDEEHMDVCKSFQEIYDDGDKFIKDVVKQCYQKVMDSVTTESESTLKEISETLKELNRKPILTDVEKQMMQSLRDEEKSYKSFKFYDFDAGFKAYIDSVSEVSLAESFYEKINAMKKKEVKKKSELDKIKEQKAYRKAKFNDDLDEILDSL